VSKANSKSYGIQNWCTTTRNCSNYCPFGSESGQCPDIKSIAIQCCCFWLLINFNWKINFLPFHFPKKWHLGDPFCYA
jgi:hypothetical protein